MRYAVTIALSEAHKNIPEFKVTMEVRFIGMAVVEVEELVESTEALNGLMSKAVQEVTKKYDTTHLGNVGNWSLINLLPLPLG